MAGELAPGEKRLHAGLALWDIEVEGALAVLLGIDQVGDLSSLGRVLQFAEQEDQHQRQGCKPLLAVDDKLDAVLVANDDRPEEVVAVAGHVIGLVAWLVAL